MCQYWVNDWNFSSYGFLNWSRWANPNSFGSSIWTCFVLIHGLPVVDVHSIGAFVRSITLLFWLANPWEFWWKIHGKSWPMKAWHILAFCMSVRVCVCVLISRCGKWTGKKTEKKKQWQFEPKIQIPRFFLEAVQLYRLPHRHRLYPSWHRCTIKAWLGILRKRVCLKIEYSQFWFIIMFPMKIALFFGVWCTPSPTPSSNKLPGFISHPRGMD